MAKQKFGPVKNPGSVFTKPKASPDDYPMMRRGGVKSSRK